MDESSSSYLIVIFLILLTGTITLLYAALINTRRTYLSQLVEDGNTRAVSVLNLLDGKPRLQITYRLTITLLYFVTASASAATFARPLLDGEQAVLGFGVVLLVAALTLIFGDLVPEAIGTVYAESLALFAIYPMQLLMLLFKPLVLVLLAISKVISAAFGSDTMVNTVTEEEIMTLVDAGHSGGTIEEEEKDMIYSVLQLDQTQASELMTPRMDIVAVDIGTPLDEALKVFSKSGFSRIPIYEDNIDNITGLLYVKDVIDLLSEGRLDPEQTVRKMVRPAHFVPETKRADMLLKELQHRKVHMAIVVDEYGGTAGLVTIENLIEEIVGDIQDEFDLHEEAEYVLSGEGEYLLDAGMNIDDLNELLDVDIETDDANTVGGYILAILGRVPTEGETIHTDNLTMRVMAVEGRRIRKVKVTPQKSSETTNPKEETPDSGSSS